MRRFSLLIVAGCLAAAGNLYAQQSTEAAEAGTTRQAQPETRVPPVKREARQPEKPAATFTPSEKIGADSAISFPVDI
ncbi:MAG: hypothetical protein PVG72_11025 [Gammaproteobacteria bacterium]|jgi:hypothetical protein